MKRTASQIVWPYIVAMFLSVFVFSSLQAAEIVFDEKTLSKFGTKKYKMTWIDRSSGSPVEHERGTMILSVDVTKDEVSLKNVTRMYLPDGKRFIEYQTSCYCSSDGKLSLRRIDTEVTRSDKVVLHESQTAVEKDKVTHKFTDGGKDFVLEQDWIEGTLPDLAVFFLVPQLSQKKGEIVLLENVMATPTTTIKKPKNQTITCLGIDREMSTDGQKLTKFVNTTKGEKSGITYWVDENGLLRRVQLNSENRLDLVTK